MLQRKHPIPLFYESLEGLRLFVELRYRLFQKPDSPAHAALSDIGGGGVVNRIDALQTVAVIEHAVPCDSDALQAQLVQIFTLDYLSQKEVYVSPDVIPPGLHFLRERPRKHRVAVF